MFYFLYMHIYTHTYVLLTANLDDFRSIAKKFVPEKLADQLTEMAAAHGKKVALESHNSEYQDDDINYNLREKVKSSEETVKKSRVVQKPKGVSIKGHEQDINFDELVQKVREQIERGNQNKFQRPLMDNSKYVRDDSNTFNEEQGYRQPIYKDENLPKQHINKNKPQGQQQDNHMEYIKEDSFNNEDQGNTEMQYNENLPKQHHNIDKYKTKPQGQPIVENYKYDDNAKDDTNGYYKENYANSDNKYQENNPYRPNEATESRDNINSYYNENNANLNNKYQAIKPYKHEPATGATEKNEQYYDDKTEIIENDEIFKAADLTKTNDSYEDYVTPKKDDVFESDGETTQKLPKNTNRVPQQSNYREKNIKAVAFAEKHNLEYDYNDNEDRVSEEVKAKTANLNYQKGAGYQKKLKGTMIPTREYFKLSSPNYYAKLPAVAEKYDFDEPLPEADREPENLAHIRNPPASINKKVRLTES